MPYCKQILHRIHCFKEKQRLVSLFCIVKLMIHLKMHLSPFLQQKLRFNRIIRLYECVFAYLLMLTSLLSMFLFPGEFYTSDDDNFYARTFHLEPRGHFQLTVTVTHISPFLLN